VYTTTLDNISLLPSHLLLCLLIFLLVVPRTQPFPFVFPSMSPPISREFVFSPRRFSRLPKHLLSFPFVLYSLVFRLLNVAAFPPPISYALPLWTFMVSPDNLPSDFPPLVPGPPVKDFAPFWSYFFPVDRTCVMYTLTT